MEACLNRNAREEKGEGAKADKRRFGKGGGDVNKKICRGLTVICSYSSVYLALQKRPFVRKKGRLAGRDHTLSESTNPNLQKAFTKGLFLV